MGIIGKMHDEIPKNGHRRFLTQRQSQADGRSDLSKVAESIITYQKKK